MDKVNEKKEFYEKVLNSPLKFLKGSCRFHLAIVDWEHSEDIDEFNKFLTEEPRKISFALADGTLIGTLQVLPGMSDTTFKPDGDVFNLYLSLGNFGEGDLNIFIKIKDSFPYLYEIGEFVAMLPIEK